MVTRRRLCPFRWLGAFRGASAKKRYTQHRAFAPSFLLLQPANIAARRGGALGDSRLLEGVLTETAVGLPLLLFSLALFGRTLFGDQALYARDVLHYYWPMHAAAAELIRRFELPQWAPFAQSGLPFLADIHAGVLYPPHVLYQLLSFPRAYAWLVFLHHLAAGVGALVLFRRMGTGRSAAVCGALVYMLSGYLVGLMNAGSLMAGAAYLPWVLAVTAGPLQLSWKIPLVASLLALQSLTGDPQSVLLSALSCGAFVAWSRHRKPLFWALLGGFALAGLLAAVQLVPAWHVLGESNRAAVDSRFFEQFALHPLRLLELFAPFPLGGYLARNHFWATFAVKGPGVWPFALSAYLGAASATVVVLGVRRDWRTGFGATLLIAGLLLALGPHGPMASILSLPPFRFFRYPEKYLLLASFGFAALVSQSIERIRAREVSRERLTVVGTALALGAAGIGAVYLFHSDVQSFLTGVLRAFAPRVSAAVAEATLLGSAKRALTCAAAAWLLCLLARLVVSAQAAVVALAALIGLDLFLPARSLVFTAPVEMFHRQPKLVEVVNEAAPTHPFRYMRDFSQGRSFDRESQDSYLGQRAWELDTLKSNLGGVFRLEEVGGYAGGFSLKRWEAVAVALYDSPAKLAALFNGCVAIEPVTNGHYAHEPQFQRTALDSQSGLTVYRNQLCQPRLRTVSRVISAAGLDEAVRLVASPDFDVSSQAVVEGMEPRALGPAQVSQMTVATSQASAEITAPPGGTFVVFATSYYPGWTARVDGRPATLKIVNGATMGVEVGEGDHRVEFAFSDPGLKVGLMLSLAGVLLAIASALVGKKLLQLLPRAAAREPAAPSVSL